MMWRTDSVQPTGDLGICGNYIREFGNLVDHLIHGLDVVTGNDGDDVRVSKKRISMHYARDAAHPR